MFGRRNLVARFSGLSSHAGADSLNPKVDEQWHKSTIALSQGPKSGLWGENQVVGQAQAQDFCQGLPVNFDTEVLLVFVCELDNPNGIPCF